MDPFIPEQFVRSFSFDQQEILRNILRLYIPGGCFDVDPTYSKGQFYSDGTVPQPHFKYDLYPQYADVIQADCRKLPLDSESVGSIIFDPPFLATTGPSLGTASDSNRINKRFGVYPSEQALHSMYRDAIREFHRILRPGGVLVFKCQDKVSSGKQYMSHAYIFNMAELQGFYAIDLFVLAAKNRLVAQWQCRQKHARKYHSYFWVFQKPVKDVKMSWVKLQCMLDVAGSSGSI